MFEEYKYRIGMHTHSFPVSPCSTLTPADLVQLYVGAGVDAMVLTNHLHPYFLEKKSVDTVVGEYMEAYHTAKRIGSYYGLKVLLGIEPDFVNTPDCLIYGADEDTVRAAATYVTGPIEKFREEYRRDRMFFAQAHPFRSGHKLIDPSLLDGVEVFNMNPGHYGKSAIAARYASKHNLIPTCGDDCHSVGEQCMAVLRTKTLPSDSFELADILFSRDFVFDMGGFIVVPYSM